MVLISLPRLLWAWRTKRLPLGWLGLPIQITAIDPPLISGYDLEEIWFIGSGLNKVISNCSTMFLLLWQQKPRIEFCHDTFHTKILHQNLGPSSFGMPRSAPSSPTVSCRYLLTAAHTRSTFSGVLLVAGLPEHASLSTDSQPSLKHLCHIFICAPLTTLSPKAFWIIRIVPTEECSSLMQN